MTTTTTTTTSRLLLRTCPSDSKMECCSRARLGTASCCPLGLSHVTRGEGGGGMIMFCMPKLSDHRPRVLRRTALCSCPSDFRPSIALSYVAKCRSSMCHLPHLPQPSPFRANFYLLETVITSISQSQDSKGTERGEEQGSITTTTTQFRNIPHIRRYGTDACRHVPLEG